MAEPIIILHTNDGRHLAVHLGKDRIVGRSVSIAGRTFDVRETVTEIATIIRTADWVRRNGPM